MIERSEVWPLTIWQVVVPPICGFYLPLRNTVQSLVVTNIKILQSQILQSQTRNNIFIAVTHSQFWSC